MAFTPSELEEIRAAVHRARTQPCPSCGQEAAAVVSSEGFVMLTLQEDIRPLQPGDAALPCVAVTCQRCGKTDLLNALILGLGDLVERYSPPEPARAG